MSVDNGLAKGENAAHGSDRDVADSEARIGRRLDGLIGMLSHDLRTPLSAISGWLFLLESGKLDADGQKRALGKIRTSIEEQVRLIDDTLSISRGATGRLEMGSTPLALADILATAIDTIRPQADAKGIAVEHERARARVTIAGDRDRLQRAFELLLAHAVRVTPAAGRISVVTEPRPAAVEISIEDTGTGWSAGDLPWVFDPFGRPSEGGGHGARGIERGLLLAHALIVAHGGRLQVGSEGTGRGESFTIALPVAGSDSVASH